MSIEIDNLITIKEVAKMLHRSQRTIWERCQRKEIPHFRIGGKYLFDKKAIEKWLEEHHHDVKQEDAVIDEAQNSDQESSL